MTEKFETYDFETDYADGMLTGDNYEALPSEELHELPAGFDEFTGQVVLSNITA